MTSIGDVAVLSRHDRDLTLKPRFPWRRVSSEGLLRVVLYLTCVWLLGGRVLDATLPRIKAVSVHRQRVGFLRAEGRHLIRPSTTIRYGGGHRAAIVFTDYECPGCKLQEEVLIRGVPNGVSVTYLNLPIQSLHHNARRGATLALCASESGAFEQVHRMLFADTGWKGTGTVRDWLESFGMTSQRASAVSECVAQDRATGLLEKDIRIAHELVLRGTPGWVIGDSVGVGVLNSTQLAEILETTSTADK